jgi:hypothetical protein
MEERKTMGKQTITPQAAAIPPGLTTRPPTLYELGTQTGLTPETIDQATTRKHRILNILLIITAAVLGTLSYAALATPGHYTGVSIQDFNTIGQGIYQMFGRL